MSNSFVAIDVETAIGKRWSICQIGLVFFENNQVVDSINEYIQPPNNEYHFMNTRIHKITAEDTSNKPFFPEIWKTIQPLIEGKILVAHNAAFDLSCLNQTLEYYNLEKQNFNFYCTYKMSNLKLNIACNNYNIPLEKHHDADCDAKACGALYIKLLQAGIEPRQTNPPKRKSQRGV